MPLLLPLLIKWFRVSLVFCFCIYIFLDINPLPSEYLAKTFSRPTGSLLCYCFFCWIPLCFSGMCRFSGLFLAAGDDCSKSSPRPLC